MLEQHFPGEPQLAYFELAANRSLDPEDIIAQALTLARAGYEIDPQELSERTGYQLQAAQLCAAAAAEAADAGGRRDREDAATRERGALISI